MNWLPPTDTPWGAAVVTRQIVTGVPLWYVIAEMKYPVLARVSGYMVDSVWAANVFSAVTLHYSVPYGVRYACWSIETGEALALEWECVELFDFQTKDEDKEVHRDIIQGALEQRLPDFLTAYMEQFRRLTEDI